MYLTGQYIGLGLGDRSPEVVKAKAKLKAKFTPARNTLDDGDLFTLALDMEVRRVQVIYAEQGREGAPRYIPGVINLEFKYDLGILTRPPKPKPIIFTLEGHQSNMFFGPCATVASTLEQQGVCHWKPVWYDNDDIPFKNQYGRDALNAQLAADWIEGGPVDPNNPDGPKMMWDFRLGINHGIVSFSQGAMIVSEVMMNDILPANGKSHHRLASFKRGLAFGNPRRERGACAPWAQSPPDPNSHGIMDVLFEASKTAVKDRWMEHPNDDDMFAEVTDDAMSKDQTAIAKIITEGDFFGGQLAIWRRVLAIFGNPVGEGAAALMASFDAIMFLAANPNPHYSTYATGEDIEWMRGVAA